MRVAFLIIFAFCIAILALNGCSRHEEHGLPLQWSSG
jgi:hypothetical protein